MLKKIVHAFKKPVCYTNVPLKIETQHLQVVIPKDTEIHVFSTQKAATVVNQIQSYFQNQKVVHVLN